MKRRLETMDAATSITNSVAGGDGVKKEQQKNGMTRNSAKNSHSTNVKKQQIPRRKSKTKKVVEEIDPAIVKEKLVARVTVLPENKDQKQIFHFNWSSSSSSSVVPDSKEQFMKQKLIVKGYYGKCPTLSQDILQKSSMTMPQIISLRSSLLQQKSLFRNISLQKERKHLYKLYQNGSTIVDLSKKMDYPPMNLFRTILSEKGFSKNKVKKAIVDPKQHLCHRGQTECIAAKIANCGLPDAQKEASILKYASDFEDIIADWLSVNGISFVRQEQLVREQTKEFGKAIVTPDTLLLDDVIINGNKIAWIDCKAYYGANIPFNIKNMKKQIFKYIDHWGHGAIIYLTGYNEKLPSILEPVGCSILNAHDIVNCSSGKDSIPTDHRHSERLLKLQNLISETTK